MAFYRTELTIPTDVETAFDYISDFRHAPTWDPRASRAERTAGEGPIGLGSAFVIYSPSVLGTQVLPYEIVEFDRPRLVVFRGSAKIAEYEDRISFASSPSIRCYYA